MRGEKMSEKKMKEEKKVGEKLKCITHLVRFCSRENAPNNFLSDLERNISRTPLAFPSSFLLKQTNP
jgi:hypothetical protein